MNSRTLLMVVTALVSGAACSTTTPIGAVDNGGASGSAPIDTTGSAGAAGVPSVPQTGSVPPVQATCSPLSTQIVADTPFTNPPGMPADWIGHFENFHLRSGSDAVKLHLGVDAGGHGTLTLVVGAGTVPPLPTDAWQVWPPQDGAPFPSVDLPRPFEGWVYTAHEVSWQGNRLQFSVLDAEPWTAWCGLQTSYPIRSGSELPPENRKYACNEDWNVDFISTTECHDEARPEVRCTPYHFQMCMPKFGYCACDCKGCTLDTTFRTTYDLTFFADRAEGSSVGRQYGPGQPNSVRLTPAAP